MRRKLRRVDEDRDDDFQARGASPSAPASNARHAAPPSSEQSQLWPFGFVAVSIARCSAGRVRATGGRLGIVDLEFDGTFLLGAAPRAAREPIKRRAAPPIVRVRMKMNGVRRRIVALPTREASTFTINGERQRISLDRKRLRFDDGTAEGSVKCWCRPVRLSPAPRMSLCWVTRRVVRENPPRRSTSPLRC